VVLALPLALAGAILGGASAAPVADCGQAAIPLEPVEAEARPSDIRFGQFRLLAARRAREQPPGAFKRGRDGKYRGQKIAAALPPGPRARLAVARKDRRNASLLYARPQPDGGRYRIRQGRAVERFEPCPDRELTIWPGYVIVRGPRCVTLEVRVGDGRAVRKRVAFGRTTCRKRD
jgi:hypothetical protein